MMMLHAYPEYQDAFFAAARNGHDDGPEFNRKLRESLQGQWPILAARWRLMCHDLDYGFDWSRERVALSASDPEWDGRPINFRVAADQGWQSIGVRIPGRTRIKLSPSGQITLADRPKPWTSEPAGITFQYHRGRPLGELTACVLPNAFDPQAKSLTPLDVRPIDKETTLEISQYSWLLLRVNDDVGNLADNTGEYEVTDRAIELSIARSSQPSVASTRSGRRATMSSMPLLQHFVVRRNRVLQFDQGKLFVAFMHGIENLHRVHVPSPKVRTTHRGNVIDS